MLNAVLDSLEPCDRVAPEADAANSARGDTVLRLLRQLALKLAAARRTELETIGYPARTALVKAQDEVLRAIDLRLTGLPLTEAWRRARLEGLMERRWNDSGASLRSACAQMHVAEYVPVI